MAPEWYRALYLTERGVPRGTPASDQTATEAKLEPWRRNPVFRGDESQFVARLRVDQRTVSDLAALLSETAKELRARSPALPSDLARAARAIDSAGKDDEATHSLVGEIVESSFSRACLRLAEPLLTPALRTLREGLAERLDGSAIPPDRASDALRAWVKTLPARIDPLFLRTLALEVNLARMDGKLTGETREQRFDDFARRLAEPRARRSFFRRYPVLARQLQSRIDYWVAFGLDFFAHLARDYPDIRRAFGFDAALPVAIDGGEADAHRGGRSVLLLAFPGGEKLVYKPRGLSLDVHFQGLLAWLNERRAPTSPALRTLRILDRADHGWCEFVEARSCESEAELERFYWRQGAYLALLYALEATDFHSENVIASGEHPVLVDLEALFSPRLPELAARWARDPAIHAWLNSVMRIGLLPIRTYTKEDEEGIDVTGLGHRPGQMGPRIPMMDGLGTDEMRVDYARVPLDVQQSAPRLRDQHVDISSHLEPIIAGFRATYLLLSSTRDELRKGPLASFRGDETRIILLATWIYDRNLRTSLHPQCLGDALERDPILDRIWRTPELGERYQRVFRAERAELLNGDIPYFRTRVDGNDIESGRGDRFEGFLARSGYQGVTERIARFSDADLERQVWFIRAAFATIPLGKAENTLRSYGGKRTPSDTRPASLLSMAEAIGRRLVTLAIQSDGRTGWLGVSLVNAGEWRLLPASGDLYNGASGIALFLAYLARLTRDSVYRRVARAALATALEYVAKLEETPDQVVTIAPLMGMSGTVFLLTHLGDLWREPALLDRAEEIVALLSGRIEADRNFDLLDGTAGFLSALLALYRVRRAPSVLDLARRCADHLVSHAIRSDGVVGCHWPSRLPTIAPMTGLSHGNSGIALGLHRAWRSTEESKYRATAAEAIAYERSVFCADARNWPDFRAPASTDREPPDAERQRFMVAWCHGAPGIGLSRVGMLQNGDDPELQTEIDAAIATTLAQGFGHNHSLCHGDLGNVDLLLASPHRDALREDIARVMAMIIESIRDHGWITGVPFGVESPGLMTGLAGTGYELLRLFAPSEMPSVLLLEPPAGG